MSRLDPEATTTETATTETTDTIAACSTATANAPAAMIRVSGPACAGLAKDRLGIDPFARCCIETQLTLGHYALPVTAICYESPASYTGEHVIEIMLPGNPTLIERVLDSLEGVRRANPGEFSARAYLCGRLTLEQAEGVAQAITAETDAELDAARSLLSGDRGETYRGWTDRLAQLLALTEAGIDFTDQEDVVAITPGDLVAGLETLRGEIVSELGATHGSEIRATRPTVALVGRPSAGKSTLFNALLDRDRALVHEAPGTTRDVIAEPLDLAPVAAHAGLVDLLDLPGLEHERATAEAVRAANEADLRVYCDPSARFDLEFPSPTLRVRTKADLSQGSPGGDELPVCSLDGYGLSSLRRAIADHASRTTPGVPPRHTAAFSRAVESLDTAAAHATPDELSAGAMRDALDALASLTGEVTPDDVIGRVFASFCVGK